MKSFNYTKGRHEERGRTKMELLSYTLMARRDQRKDRCTVDTGGRIGDRSSDRTVVEAGGGWRDRTRRRIGVEAGGGSRSMTRVGR
jgi:hypothetical protein